MGKFAGPKMWNNLPQSVRSADSLDSFKRKLKFYLFNTCFNVWTVYVCVLCSALSARFFDVDRALNSYFMIMIMGQISY